MANVPQQEVFVNTLNFLNSFMARHIIFCLLSVKQFFFSSWPLLKLLTDWNLKFQDTFYLNVPIKPCLSPWYAKRNVFIWLMMESDFEIFDNVWSFIRAYMIFFCGLFLAPKIYQDQPFEHVFKCCLLRIWLLWYWNFDGKILFLKKSFLLRTYFPISLPPSLLPLLWHSSVTFFLSFSGDSFRILFE